MTVQYLPEKLGRSTMAVTVVSALAWLHAGSDSRDEAYILRSSVESHRPKLYARWEEATSATVRASVADLEAIDQLFVVSNGRDVREFLASRPKLLALILEALMEGKSYFPDTQPLLDIAMDSESDRVGMAMLFPTSESPDAALKRLSEFDEAWWLANMNRADGLLTVAVEFV
jgi:hypothetical protein